MGGDIRYPRAVALEAAEDLIERLAPFVVRAEIVGSLRRGKPDVGDIEILYEPKFVPGEPTGLFGDTPSEPINQAYDYLSWLRESGELQDRPDKNGRPAFGQRMQRMIWDDIPCDLFAVFPPAHWGVIQLIRTGSADFSHRIMTPKPHGHMPFGMRVQDGQLLDRGEPLDIPTEEAFFKALGMEFVPPEARL